MSLARAGSVALALLVLAGGRGTAGEPAPSAPAAPPRPGLTLTVYSSADPAGFDPARFVAEQRAGRNPNAASQVPGYGIVKDVRSLDVPAGLGEVRVTDVAAFVDPTTVAFADLSGEGDLVVREQALRFDLASPDKILERYVEKSVAVETVRDGAIVGTISGTVLSVNEGTVVLRVPDGTLRYVSTRDPGLRLPALPDGLLTRPTLVWETSCARGGPRLVRTSYETSGLTWRADYNVVLNPDVTKASLGAWVTLLNLSGASYRGARLKLVAGDVQKIERPARELLDDLLDAKSHEGDRDEGGFTERSFFEYHLYTLGRPTDVLDASTQQLALFPTVSDVAVERLLVFDGLPESASWPMLEKPRGGHDYGGPSKRKVDVYVRFENRRANRLGMPMPKGRIRVFQRDDADGSLEFVGEDLIDHTPKDETVLVRLGQAFDVAGERLESGFSIDASARAMTDVIGVTLRNRKDVPAKVLVREHLYRWTTWDITSTSDPFVKKDARTIEFEVTVPPNGTKLVSYAARYTW